jgi:Zn-dependent protease/CBS domain-containing protein
MVGGVLNNSIRLFTIRGIEVGVHYSWLIVFALLTWSLSVYQLPLQLDGARPALEYWILGALTTVLLFASVLIHELAHSFVAKARGLNAKSITLFIFGGVSNLTGEPKSPWTEFIVAIVGPLTSFVLAAISWAVATAVDEPRTEVIASYLFLINLSLGIFNLVPGFPLDGGRVLRSILWGATHSLRRATTWAANVGKVVAWLLFAVALWMLFRGDIVSGIWLAAIAWFLHNAASASVQQLVIETRLGKVRVGDVAQPLPVTAPPGISVAQLVDEMMLPHGLRAVPVTDNGRLVGIVTLADVMRVPFEQRAQATVAHVMSVYGDLPAVTTSTPVLDAIELMAEHNLEQLPVVDGGQLVGMLTNADVMRQLQLREALTPSR